MNDGADREFLLGESYTDERWTALLDTAGQLGITEQMRRDRPRANRDILLVALGYSTSWQIEGGDILSILSGGQWFTNCRRCGATIPLRPAEPEQLGALDQHTFWHAGLEGVLPNGTAVEGGA